ncbi:MAG TPA: DUF3090 family protein [Actinomycetota bacterium]|nr:DUF3090 family protein [Actinomycetota bacterium]
MELGPVDRITTDAIGEPGNRTFFIQARSGPELVTVIVEKQQVQLLAQSILEILAGIDRETEEGPGEDEMDLEEPVEPMWRVGRLAIGYDEDRDMFRLELEELLPEDEEEGEGPEPDRVLLWATREQMLALSRHSAAVAARGRPTCRFCGNPIDPEGHRCPAMNGHRDRG